MNIATSMKSIFEKRNIMFELAKMDFKKRFAGSYFGVVWIFLQPVVTVVIYYCVFQLGFKANPSSSVNAPYVLWLIPGMVPWFYFNEAVQAGTNSLYEYNYLVKKVVFKVGSIPVIKNISCMFVHAMFICIMLVVFLLYGYAPKICWFQIIYYSFCTFMLITGLSFFTSAITVFFKDMAQIVSIAVQFGMWVTPIMWDYHMFGERLIPFLKINPFFYIAEGYRDSMLNGVWFWERPGMTLYFWCAALLILILGVTVFKRMKPYFADVL